MLLQQRLCRCCPILQYHLHNIPHHKPRQGSADVQIKVPLLKTVFSQSPFRNCIFPHPLLKTTFFQIFFSKLIFFTILFWKLHFPQSSSANHIFSTPLLKTKFFTILFWKLHFPNPLLKTLGFFFTILFWKQHFPNPLHTQSDVQHDQWIRLSL